MCLAKSDEKVLMKKCWHLAKIDFRISAKCAACYDVNYKVKRFSWWDQFLRTALLNSPTEQASETSKG